MDINANNNDCINIGHMININDELKKLENDIKTLVDFCHEIRLLKNNNNETSDIIKNENNNC